MIDEGRLREDLELAMADILDGRPFGPVLAHQIQRAAEDVLRAHRVSGDVVTVDGGAAVRIRIQHATRVRQLVLDLRAL